MRERIQSTATLLLVFAAGAITHAMWPIRDASTPKVDRPLLLNPAVTATSVEIIPVRTDLDEPETESAPQRTLSLETVVVDAILSGEKRERTLARMGLSDDEIETVTAIQAHGTAALKRIEEEHATFVSDDRGDHIAIDAFPAERDQWLQMLEDELRDLLADDRAAVVARMIAFAENDEDIGVYRREVFVTETAPAQNGDTLRIEERSFSESGQHIDSDYELITPRSRTRWQHLLDLGSGE